MVTMPPDDFEWPSPWSPIQDENDCLMFPRILSENFGNEAPAEFLVAELEREMWTGHLLHGRSCVAVAQATDDPNEFVFATNHPELPVAFVHLTWQVEKSPDFPHTVGYSSWQVFKQEWSQRS